MLSREVYCMKDILKFQTALHGTGLSWGWWDYRPTACSSDHWLAKLQTSRHNRCCFWTGRHFPGSSSTRENQHDIKMCSDLWEKLFLVLQESLEQESIEDSEIRTLNKNWPKFLNSLCSLLRDKDLELEDLRGGGATLSLPKLETSRHNRCCFWTGRHYSGSSSTRENQHDNSGVGSLTS